MSRNLANGLGIASLAILVILVVNDVESISHHDIAFPTEVRELLTASIGVLAGAYLVYRIVRGRPLDPSFSEAKLRSMMEDAARKVVREELESLSGDILVRELRRAGIDDIPVQRALPRPHLVRSKEGS